MTTVRSYPRTAESALTTTSIYETVERMGEPPWETVLMVDERNAYTLMCDMPGASNRPHWHDDFDEVWYVAQGELEWEISAVEGSGVKRVATYSAKVGDLIYCPKGLIHVIRTVGTENSLRMGVGPPVENIVWADEYFPPSS